MAKIYHKWIPSDLTRCSMLNSKAGLILAHSGYKWSILLASENKGSQGFHYWEKGHSVHKETGPRQLNWVFIWSKGKEHGRLARTPKRTTQEVRNAKYKLDFPSQ